MTNPPTGPVDSQPQLALGSIALSRLLLPQSSTGGKTVDSRQPRPAALPGLFFVARQLHLHPFNLIWCNSPALTSPTLFTRRPSVLLLVGCSLACPPKSSLLIS